jgi:cytochrome c biogenesis factor
MEVGGLFALLIYLIVIGLVFYLLYWLIGQLPIPEPFKTVVLVVVGLIAVILLLNIVFGFAPGPVIRWR